MRKMIVLPAVVLILFGLFACGGGPAPVYCDPAGLVPPVLSLPVDGGNFIPGSSQLQWYYPDGSCEPEGYRAEVSPASDFSSDVQGASTTWPNSVGWPLMASPGTTYYWRVRPFVGSVDGPWSAVWMFNGAAACATADLAVPEPLFPEDGHEFWYDAPSYEWTYSDPSCEPEGYHLQVATDAAFTALVLDKQENDPSTLWVPTEPYLTDCTIYHWRVAAVSGGMDGPYADGGSFYVNTAGACPAIPCPMTGLEAPVSGDPSHYQIIDTLMPELGWEYPAFCDPDGFAVRIAPDYHLDSVPLQGGLGLSGSWITPALEPATQYWWDVAAIVPPALGPFSARQTFFTGPECGSSAELGTPELVYPVNGQVVNSEYAWLHYSASPFGCIPDGYAADLQTDPGFSGTNLLGTYMFPATNIITDPLEDCTTYYWKIAAIQDGVTGAYSEAEEFFTNFSGTCIQPVARPLSGLALRDLVCRAGPSLNYDILGYFLTSEESPIFAQNLGQTYWVIENPDWPGTTCWVLQDGVEPSGETGDVNFWRDPEIGAPQAQTPACSENLSRTQCAAAGGTYRDSITRSSYCECP